MVEALVSPGTVQITAIADWRCGLVKVIHAMAPVGAAGSAAPGRSSNGTKAACAA